MSRYPEKLPLLMDGVNGNYHGTVNLSSANRYLEKLRLLIGGTEQHRIAWSFKRIISKNKGVKSYNIRRKDGVNR